MVMAVKVRWVWISKRPRTQNPNDVTRPQDDYQHHPATSTTTTAIRCLAPTTARIVPNLTCSSLARLTTITTSIIFCPASDLDRPATNLERRRRPQHRTSRCACSPFRFGRLLRHLRSLRPSRMLAARHVSAVSQSTVEQPSEIARPHAASPPSLRFLLLSSQASSRTRVFMALQIRCLHRFTTLSPSRSMLAASGCLGRHSSGT
ncbi:hypothetical protein HDK77DRAFT_65102 [Phyllosticta capitalensis]|uniref:Uncharacterized protein n=1 Tax=Phyllosticta capitalensis TaxID=121624 RepID=A0ABR1YRQ9_9PEZI